ncbi:MAG TPA: diguanylate cyclase [Betaproteobacteria bacterium]|nr:diguanylate cyclase [Betaproteobacteria bacterium]
MDALANTLPLLPAACRAITGRAETLACLHDILEQKRLDALFQPIIDMRNGAIIGFEGLIRGPADTPLHAPIQLFSMARQFGLTFELEILCCQVLTEHFVKQQLPGRLFLNISPDILMRHYLQHRDDSIAFAEHSWLEPSRLVLELTENVATRDSERDRLLDAVDHYRAQGVQIAIDDLGEGYASLHLWSVLRPDFVKIDRHFIQSIDHDSLKAQFVRSIQEIAHNAGTQVIAEGIETPAEFQKIKTLGISLGQGYHIARPTLRPETHIDPEITRPAARRPNAKLAIQSDEIEKKLLKLAPPVMANTPNEQVYYLFNQDPELDAVPVVNDNQTPIGLINRYFLVDRFARPYRRELYGKKPCTAFMDADPLIVDKNLTIQELSRIVIDVDRRHLANGFIITDNGRYLGMGRGHDLMREITELQIHAARYANPLTQLPGNVPIIERIGLLLRGNLPFCACYCDLDHFKPFNDAYGFSKGDAIIQLTGKILSAICDPVRDFIGHIGGDDFIVIFRSEDWRQRCQAALNRFEREIAPFFSAQDLAQGGYLSENRREEKEFHALTTLSIGAVEVAAGAFTSHMEISEIAAESKKMAKRMPGNSLFINQRNYRGGAAIAEE